MDMTNFEIKAALKKNRIYQWELAEHLGIGESVLSRKLRKELAPEKKAECLAAIEAVAENRRTQ